MLPPCDSQIVVPACRSAADRRAVPIGRSVVQTAPSSARAAVDISAAVAEVELDRQRSRCARGTRPGRPSASSAAAGRCRRISPSARNRRNRCDTGLDKRAVQISGSALGGTLLDKWGIKLTLRKGRTYVRRVSKKDLSYQAPDYFTVGEAALLLHLHPKTVERACRRGDIPASRRTSDRSLSSSGKGQAWQISRADLFKAMLSGFGQQSPALRPELKARTFNGAPRRRRASIRRTETRSTETRSTATST